MVHVDEMTAGQESGNDVLAEVRRVLEEQCEVPADRANAVTDADLMADLGLDSITLAYVFTHFERKHDLTFENDDIDPMRYTTVGELVDAITVRLREAASR